MAVLLLLIRYCSMFCCMLLYVHSSFETILMGKKVLVTLLSLSFWCLVIVVWLLLAVQWVCRQFMSVVFPDHTHLLFIWVNISTQYLTVLFCFEVFIFVCVCVLAYLTWHTSLITAVCVF